jgi:hypothetical protein
MLGVQVTDRALPEKGTRIELMRVYARDAGLSLSALTRQRTALPHARR